MSRQPRSRFGCHRGAGSCETNRRGSQPAAGRQGQRGAAARGRSALTLPSVAPHARSDTYPRDEGHVTLVTLSIWLSARSRVLRDQSTGESASSGATRPTRSAGNACSGAALCSTARSGSFQTHVAPNSSKAPGLIRVMALFTSCKSPANPGQEPVRMSGDPAHIRSDQSLCASHTVWHQS
jgi:hypothetical protein